MSSIYTQSKSLKNKQPNNYNNSQNIVSAQHASQIIKSIYAETKMLRIIPTHFNSNGNHVRLYEQKTNKKFHIKFAREPFKKFGDFFLDGKSELGESINAEAVNDLDENDVIFFSRPEGIDRIFVGDFLEQAYMRTTQSDEKTLSISLNDLEKMI